MAGTLTFLSDEDLAVIATALLTEPRPTPTELARRLGRPYFTVAKAVQRLRGPAGWHCPLTEVMCAECGELLLISPQHPRTVHPACEPRRRAREARVARAEGRRQPSTPYVAAWRQRNPDRNAELREQERARARERWPDLPPDQQRELLGRLHEADARDYELTAAQAGASGLRWSEEDDRYVLEHLDRPAREVALALNRTLWAVRTRRMWLKRRAAVENTITN